MLPFCFASYSFNIGISLYSNHCILSFTIGNSKGRNEMTQVRPQCACFSIEVSFGAVVMHSSLKDSWRMVTWNESQKD